MLKGLLHPWQSHGRCQPLRAAVMAAPRRVAPCQSLRRQVTACLPAPRAAPARQAGLAAVGTLYFFRTNRLVVDAPSQAPLCQRCRSCLPAEPHLSATRCLGCRVDRRVRGHRQRQRLRLAGARRRRPLVPVRLRCRAGQRRSARRRRRRRRCDRSDGRCCGRPQLWV